MYKIKKTYARIQHMLTEHKFLKELYRNKGESTVKRGEAISQSNLFSEIIEPQEREKKIEIILNHCITDKYVDSIPQGNHFSYDEGIRINIKGKRFLIPFFGIVTAFMKEYNVWQIVIVTIIGTISFKFILELLLSTYYYILTVLKLT